MPSSMIFVGLVAVWLLLLVPAVARHRQEVARPSLAALSGRVLPRPRRRQSLEVNVTNDVEQVTPRTDRMENPPQVPLPRVSVDPVPAPDLQLDESSPDEVGPEDVGPEDWERPPPRYRPGRGGYDPQAAALAAQARYGFRQRVVLVLLLAAVITGVVAAVALRAMWWAHGAVDLVLVGYLGYLRRQARLEEVIRDRRAARLAGARRPAVVADPVEEPAHEPIADDWEAAPEAEVADDEEDAVDEPVVVGTAAPDVAVADLEPVEMSGLPRLQPSPPPPLPVGTALVQDDADNPDHHELAGPTRPDYRRAVGE